MARKTEKKLPFVPWQGFAVASLLVAAVVFRLVQVDPAPDTVAQVATADPSPMDGLLTDLPLLASGDDVEFYQDLEFLLWLETNNDNAG